MRQSIKAQFNSMLSMGVPFANGAKVKAAWDGRARLMNMTDAEFNRAMALKTRAPGAKNNTAEANRWRKLALARAALPLPPKRKLP